MSTIDELVVRIRADSAQLQAELANATQAVRQASTVMGSSMNSVRDAFRALVPALSVAALIEFGKRAIDAAGHINDLADRIGFSAGTLSALEIPLASAGSGLDEFALGINKLNDTLGNALAKNQQAVKAFHDLGLSVNSLKNMTPEQRFYEVVKALGKTKDQSELTMKGMNLLGKAFAVLQPTLKEHNFDIGKVVDEHNKLGDALGPDKLKRIDDFGDAMREAAIKARNGFLGAFADILNIIDTVGGFIDKVKQFSVVSSSEMSRARMGNYGISDTSHRLNLTELSKARATASYGVTFGPNGRQDLSSMQAALNKQLEEKGLNPGGSDGDLVNANPAQEYLEKLRQQNKLLQMSERDAAAAGAEYDLRNLAAKDKTVGINETMIAQARELAKANYDLQHQQPVPDPDNSAFMAYLRNLDDEYDSLSKNDRQLAVDKALRDARAAAQSDYNDGLRTSGELTKEEIARVTEFASKTYDLKDVMKTVHDSITTGLTDIILHFNNAGDAARSFAESLASTIIQKSISTPLADAATSFIKDLNLGSLFGGGRAGGGPVNAGTAYLVGENGPEIFRPDVNGSISSRGSGGVAGGVAIYHTWNISPGIQGTVRAELMGAIPSIVAASKNAVIAAVQKGGGDSKQIRG